MTGLFSSKNAVRIFYKYLNQLDVKYVAVIGQKTAELCEALKINVDFIPNDYSQEGFLNQFKRINKAFSYRVVLKRVPNSNIH